MKKVLLKEFLRRWMAECPNAQFKWDSYVFDNPSNLISANSKFEDGFIVFERAFGKPHHYGNSLDISNLPASDEWVNSIRFIRSVRSFGTRIETFL